jgi:hypothetical protein
MRQRHIPSVPPTIRCGNHSGCLLVSVHYAVQLPKRRVPAGAKLTWEYVVDVRAYSSLIPGNGARKELDATELMK